MTTITDIAAAIRKHSPGALPESLLVESAPAERLWAKSNKGTYPLPSDIAAAVLIAAMVKSHGAFWMARMPSLDGWEVRHLLRDCSYEWDGFADSDHGGTLGACFAAWKWAKGIA